MMTAIWWLLVAAAAWQAWKAWGVGTAVGAVVGLILLSYLPLVGYLLSVAATIYVGYRAETAPERQLTVR